MGALTRIRAAQDFVNAAKAGQISFRLGGRAPGVSSGSDLRRGSSPEAMRYMDCSEFVSRVLAKDGVNGIKEGMTTEQLQTALENPNLFTKREGRPEPGDVYLRAAVGDST